MNLGFRKISAGFGIAFMMLGGNTFAQTTANNPAYIIIPKKKPVIDTVKPTEPELLAANIEAKAKKEIKEYKPKPVPLADHKDYFGKDHAFMVKYTRNYMNNHTRLFTNVKNKGEKKFATIDKILTKHGIPKELKYLAVIESALNPNAVSPVGAVGPWQFMEGTARNFGLKVSQSRDDRRDWNKSTDAAARYLKVLYRQLNDWLLVVAAYNSGPVPVNRAIQRTGSRNFWDIKKYLPKETQGHVLAFVATATVFEKFGKHIGTSDLSKEILRLSEKGDSLIIAEAEPPKPKFTDEELKMMSVIKLKEPLSLEIFCQELEVDRKLMDSWNEDYDLFVLDQTGDKENEYMFRMPKEKLESYFAKRELIQKKSKIFFRETAN